MKVDKAKFCDAGGIRCDVVLEHLDDFLEEQLDAETCAKIEAHLSACGNCAAFGRSYATMVAALKKLRAPVNP